MKKPRFSPSLCVTHDCNLNCLYCYQKHDTTASMSMDIARDGIDWIFDHIPTEMSGVEIGFIGGEPLLQFELIKDVVEYTRSKERKEKFVFYATTNGTLLTDEMKKWFIAHKDIFILALSIDGAKETHDHNRSDSFDDIDIDFFVSTWPEQSIKMTLSEYSLPRLSENVKYLHTCGFKEIGGVNLFEGNFDWSQDKFINLLIPQLNDLVDFYVENNTLVVNQMLNKRLDFCEASQKSRRKWCGIGIGTVFIDTDGTKFPCPLVTSMTFSEDELTDIMKADFTDDEIFIDEECFQKCYLYPICPTCVGANYLNTKKINIRDKRKCRIQKLVALFIADLQARRIRKDPGLFDKDTLYHTIEAIKVIQRRYLPEYEVLIRRVDDIIATESTDRSV